MAKKITEVGRRCQRCQYGWFAVIPGPAPKKMNWLDEHAVWTDPQARMTRITAKQDRHERGATQFA